MTPDYLLLGHITRDVMPDGSFAPGGTSLYAARTVHRLGKRVALVSAPAELPPDWSDEIIVAHHPSPTPPTFENRYTASGREQVLHASATPINLASVPQAWRAAPIVHLGPILAETPEDLVFAFPHALIGVTPQGWMRVWDEKLPSPIQYRPWQPSPVLLQRIDALILSIEDVRGDEELAVHYAQDCRLVALTRGAQGSTLFIDGQPHAIPAFPAREVDPTGAGDVFAAALLVCLQETDNPLAAARFAACVAAASVEGWGTSTIPGRAEIERRLAAQV
ncbi:MAG TPA: PfkB family carbohydrate kinase [Roseiflexaceae bacterium]|nr:PfkB family carbohydrate kinase [Roseiflexaceae bacterium]